MMVTEAVFHQGKLAYDKVSEGIARLPEVSKLAGSTVCVIGCTGLMGAAISSALVAVNKEGIVSTPIRVYGIARQPHLDAQFATPWFTFLQRSVTEDNCLRDLPSFDYVIYAAGTASDALARPRETIETQTVGLERVLSIVNPGCRFVYLSSTRVYGRRTSREPVTEECCAVVNPMHVDNVYDCAKRLGESICRWQFERRGLTTLVARLSNVYGTPRYLRSETAITDFVRQAILTGEICLRGSPESIRNYVSVPDALQGVIKLMVNGQPGHAYNVASTEHFRMGDLAAEISKSLPLQVPVNTADVQAFPNNQVVSIGKAQQELGYQPKHSFRQLAQYVVGELFHVIKADLSVKSTGSECLDSVRGQADCA